MFTFLSWMVHSGIWHKCIMGFVRLVYHHIQTVWLSSCYYAVSPRTACDLIQPAPPQQIQIILPTKYARFVPFCFVVVTLSLPIGFTRAIYSRQLLHWHRGNHMYGCSGPLVTKKTPPYGYRNPIINLRRSGVYNGYSITIRWCFSVNRRPGDKEVIQKDKGKIAWNLTSSVTNHVFFNSLHHGMTIML